MTNFELFKRLLPEDQAAFFVLWWETIHRKPDGKFRHDSAAFHTLFELANAAEQYVNALNIRNLFFCVSAQREANFRERGNPPQAIRNIERIGHLLTRPVGRPPNEVRRSYANFSYQAGSWAKPRRVAAKVEWHPGELYPRVGFLVTNLARPALNVVAFYNKRGTCEQCIKEGKGAIKWTRLSCRSFAANAVRLQLHALAYNLGNFLRTLATPEPIKDWSLTSLKEKLIKLGAKVISHGRYVAFQMAEVAIPKNLLADILRLIAELRPPPVVSTAQGV